LDAGEPSAHSRRRDTTHFAPCADQDEYLAKASESYQQVLKNFPAKLSRHARQLWPGGDRRKTQRNWDEATKIYNQIKDSNADQDVQGSGRRKAQASAADPGTGIVSPPPPPKPVEAARRSSHHRSCRRHATHRRAEYPADEVTGLARAISMIGRCFRRRSVFMNDIRRLLGFDVEAFVIQIRALLMVMPRWEEIQTCRR